MSAILKFLEKTKYQGDNDAVIGFGLPSLEAFHEQHKPTGFEKYSETFINYLKDKYSNEEWVAINEFDTPVEDIEVEEEVISPLTERGCYKGDWERLAHTTQVEADGMMKNYERSIDRFENVQEINEFITDTPFNLTAGNANASNVSEIGTFFVKPDTLTIPAENLDVTKLSNLAVSLINTYNDCAERFNALDIADKEQLEFPPLLSILSQMIHSVQTLIDKRTNSSNAPITKELLNDVPDEVIVSSESIFGNIKNMFGMGKSKNTPTQPTSKKIMYVWDRAEAIEKSPPVKLNEGHSTSLIFQQNGNYYPDWITRLEKDIAQYDRITKEIIKADGQVKRWVDKWDPILEDFKGNADRENEFIEVINKWQMDEPKIWGEVFRNDYDFIGWGKYRWEAMNDPGFGYVPMPVGPNVTIPPQDENNTKRIVKLITKLGQQILFGLGEDLTYIDYDFNSAPFRGYNSREVHNILNKIRYHAHSAESPRDHYNVVERRLEVILEALIDYVEKTIIK